MATTKQLRAIRIIEQVIEPLFTDPKVLREIKRYGGLEDELYYAVEDKIVELLK